MKNKGGTRIGFVAGVEYGARYFNPWRLTRAIKDCAQRKVDFFGVISLCNTEGLNKRFLNQILQEKRAKYEKANVPIRKEISRIEERLANLKKENSDKRKNKKAEEVKEIIRELENEIKILQKRIINLNDVKVKNDDITIELKKDFAKAVTLELAKLFPPITLKGEEEPLKYWVYRVPLFEDVKDRYGIVAFVYEFLPIVSREYHKLKSTYIRVNNPNEILEVEDDVSMKNIGILVPTVNAFRNVTLSAPPEREMKYKNRASVQQLPDIYIAGMFAATIAEMHPRGVTGGKPYVSLPSLFIRAADKVDTVLQNSLGYAVLDLYPDIKNRANFKVEFLPLDDAVDLECEYAKSQLKKLPEEIQRKVVRTIIEKVKIGTKVTVGKIEAQLNLPREKIISTIKSLKDTPFEVGFDEDLCEIKDPQMIILNTNEDLTRYRRGEEQKSKVIACACFHGGDAGVDYDFIENDLPSIIFEEETGYFIIAGDLTEGHKYNQDRKGGTVDCFPLAVHHQKLSGWLIANTIFKVFEMNYEKNGGDYRKALIEVLITDGNHDSEQASPEPVLEVFFEMLRKRLRWLIYRYLKNKSKTDPDDVAALVRDKIVYIENPGSYKDFGLIHEHMGGSKQSTGKAQNAIQAFAAQSNIKKIFLGNYHEMTFMIERNGNKSYSVFMLGTLKRVSLYENRRSKLPEFGVASVEFKDQDDQQTCVAVKFIPSRLTFRLEERKKFVEENKKKGRIYHDQIKKWEQEYS